MIDETVVTVQAGDGGDGLVSFRREKYVPRGGPDGGDGGKGGDIWFVATTGLNTLSDFNRLKQFKAPNGAPGGPKNRSGKFAQDLTLKVPIGTIIYEIGSETKKKLFDFTKPDEQYLVVKGGKGGLGNQHFATPTHQAPRYATKGEKGEQKTISLELQLIAQVGLIGLPNVGKSSLLARISKATPKIANYPFTTLEPELGVVIPEWFNINAPSFVVADIPGLIEHASQGKGLGHTFLKHIQRTEVLVHLLDATTTDLKQDYQTIRNELGAFHPMLLKKREIIVVNKIDLNSNVTFPEALTISCATHKGIPELIKKIVSVLK